MLNIKIKNICKCFSSLCKMPLLNYPFLHICCSCSNNSMAGLHQAFPLHRLLFRIHLALTLEVWLRNWSFPWAVASTLVYPHVALPISFSWELFWPGAKGRGHRPGVGQVFPYMQQLVRNRDTLIADTIWAGMEWPVNDTGILVFFPLPLVILITFSLEYMQLGKTARKILLCTWSTTLHFRTLLQLQSSEKLCLQQKCMRK